MECARKIDSGIEKEQTATRRGSENPRGSDSSAGEQWVNIRPVETKEKVIDKKTGADGGTAWVGILKSCHSL